MWVLILCLRDNCCTQILKNVLPPISMDAVAPEGAARTHDRLDDLETAPRW